MMNPIPATTDCRIDLSDWSTSVGRLARQLGKCRHIVEFQVDSPSHRQYLEYRFFAVLDSNCQPGLRPKGGCDKEIGPGVWIFAMPVSIGAQACILNWSATASAPMSVSRASHAAGAGLPQATALTDEGDPILVTREYGVMRDAPVLFVNRAVSNASNYRTLNLKIGITPQGRKRHGRVRVIQATADLPVAQNMHRSRPSDVTTLDKAALFTMELEDIALEKFKVIGNYLRYDHGTRNRLKSFLQQVLSSLSERSDWFENYMVWAEPGTGKSYLIEMLHSEHKGRFDYFYFNAPKRGKAEFEEAMAKAKISLNRPLLLFFDEIDAEEASDWACELAFNALRWNSERADQQIACVVAGSSEGGIKAMSQKINSFKNKGKDLIDCIGRGDGYKLVVPPLEYGDKVAMFSAALLESCPPSLLIDKLALYRVCTDAECSSARGVVDLAKQVRARLGTGRHVTTNHLFDILTSGYSSFIVENPSLESLFHNQSIQVTR